jgi:hypothetical protein
MLRHFGYFFFNPRVDSEVIKSFNIYKILFKLKND